MSSAAPRARASRPRRWPSAPISSSRSRASRAPMPEVVDVVIVGAGPAGLATAIAAQQAGLAYEVVEKGVLVNSIFNFPRHMTFFTTADLLEIGGLPFVSPYEKPTQMEGLKYYRRVTETYGLRVALGEEIEDVARAGRKFVVKSRSADGGERTR